MVTSKTSASRIEAFGDVGRSSNELLLGVEGSVVGRLVFGGGGVVVAGVEPFLAVPTDPGRGGELDVQNGLVRSVVEDRRAIFGALEEASL